MSHYQYFVARYLARLQAEAYEAAEDPGLSPEEAERIVTEDVAEMEECEGYLL